MRQVFLCPAGRYVDDFFGASKAGVVWHGGRCTTFVATLLGLPCDVGKDDESLSKILILGAEVAIDWACKSVAMRVAPQKALKWAQELKDIIAEKVCEQGQAVTLVCALQLIDWAVRTSSRFSHSPMTHFRGVERLHFYVEPHNGGPLTWNQVW